MEHVYVIFEIVADHKQFIEIVSSEEVAQEKVSQYNSTRSSYADYFDYQKEAVLD